MSTKFPILPIALGAALIAAPAFAAGPRGGQNNVSALSSAEAATLTFMREEEKLARDVYLTMTDRYNAVQFMNISDSEQTHMDALKNALDKYGLPDPVSVGEARGDFENATLDELYDWLISEGNKTYPDALLVGCLIEELDILDLQAAIDETSRTDLDNTYGNLMRGSRNHLRAFVAAYEAETGLVYEAQKMDPDDVQEILESPVETGGRR